MTDKLVLAVPSKGRLMDQTLEFFAKADLILRKVGSERGYRGEIEGFDNVDVAFVSASEIADQIKTGRAHLGVTGEDLLREQIANVETRVQFIRKLGFGQADVVVAVPACWIDARTIGDIEPIGRQFRRLHGRHIRVATKYRNVTRQFFTRHGITSYRIVESLGATEGAPAAGAAELIVDITTTGTTLKANGLRVLDDGTIFRSEANLVASKAAPWSPAAREAQNLIATRLAKI